MAEKLTAEQAQRIEQIQQFLRTAEHVQKLVAELEANRAGQQRVLENIAQTIARELAQMRQRAMSANIGTVADVAGAMSVMAGRGGGINTKIRGLSDGVTSLKIQLEHALKTVLKPEKKPEGPR